MGLDMYIRTQKYYSPYDKDQFAFNAIAKQDWPATPTFVTVTADVAYWRKANQIHNWFVKNVQDGEDNCAIYFVPHSQLVELRDLCAHLLKTNDPGEAHAKLPPTSGFFFGSTELDQYYWDDLQSTVDQLTPLIDAPLFSYEYVSSW